MKNKKTNLKSEPEKANISLVQPKIEVISETKSKKELLEKDDILITSAKKDMESSENKAERPKSDRPFRSRLPKLKMFIPRRPKSSSRNRGEDTKSKAKTSQKKNYSPKPSPIKRGACVSPSMIARNTSQNLSGPTTVELKTSQTEAIIEAALSPSPALTPLVTQKQQKDRENEQEKLRIINEK